MQKSRLEEGSGLEQHPLVRGETAPRRRGPAPLRSLPRRKVTRVEQVQAAGRDHGAFKLTDGRVVDSGNCAGGSGDDGSRLHRRGRRNGRCRTAGGGEDGFEEVGDLGVLLRGDHFGLLPEGGVAVADTARSIRVIGAAVAEPGTRRKRGRVADAPQVFAGSGCRDIARGPRALRTAEAEPRTGRRRRRGVGASRVPADRGRRLHGARSEARAGKARRGDEGEATAECDLQARRVRKGRPKEDGRKEEENGGDIAIEEIDRKKRVRFEETGQDPDNLGNWLRNKPHRNST